MNHPRYVSIILVLVALLVTAGVSTVAAQQDSPPGEPANFYGAVTDENGNPAPEGTTIVAVAEGSIEGQITVENAGQYGEEGAFGNKISLDSGAGDEVSFHVGNVNGSQAVESPVALDSGTYEINLTFPADTFDSSGSDGSNDDGSNDSDNTDDSNNGGSSGGSGGGSATDDTNAGTDGPPSIQQVRSTLNLVDPSTTTQTEIVDNDPNTLGTQVTPEGTESVQSISFDEESLSANVNINEYNNPPQQVREEVSSSMSGAGTVDRGNVSTISVVNISLDNDVAEESAATVTFSVPASEVDNPEQLTVIKETYDFELQEDTWTELPTTLEDAGEEKVTVSADAESFSLFAVSQVLQTDDSVTNDSGPDDSTTDDGTTDDGLPGFGASAALIALISTMLYLRQHA